MRLYKLNFWLKVDWTRNCRAILPIRRRNWHSSTPILKSKSEFYFLSFCFSLRIGSLTLEYEYREQINGNRSKGIPGARPQFERVEQQLQKDRTVLENEIEKESAAKERILELEAALKDKRTKEDLMRIKGTSIASHSLFPTID
jgi:hypothetical protein